MPWATPTLKEVRSLVRDMIHGNLPGADANVPNSVLRVLSDNQGALCHLTLQYIDWLAKQLIPDTAEHEWLDRHGDIWLTDAGGTTGRKMATLAEGIATFTNNADFGGVAIPQYTQLTYLTITYETLEEVITPNPGVSIPVPIRALDPGVAGNLDPGTQLGTLFDPSSGIAGAWIVDYLTGGTDEETDDYLRIRVLERIRQPPQGGADHDYVRWAKAVSGVTRAWCAPLEMGIGTVTVRFLMDDEAHAPDGWPTYTDIAAVTEYIDSVRPVAVKDFWVLAPVKQRIDIRINNLNPDTSETRAAVLDAINAMLFAKAKPGQTIYAAWKNYTIMNTPGVISFSMPTSDDDVMESPGHMAVLGDFIYDNIRSTYSP